MQIRLRKGLDVRLTGAPEQVIEAGRPVRSAALLGADYSGLRPRIAVREGEHVRLGQPLFFDKRDAKIAFTAPGSGRVRAINRGHRRALTSLVIELDDDVTEVAENAGAANLDGVEAVRTRLLRSGLWTAFRTRPFSRIPPSDAQPHAIFVTAIDTQPLSGNPSVVIAAQSDAFVAGVEALTRLTDGNVFVCTGPNWTGPSLEAGRIRQVAFAGPHPAGLPGTHIHHLAPASAQRPVWHIGYQDVIAAGKLIGGGVLSVERTVALGGGALKRPRLVSTRAGAAIDDLLDGELHEAAAGLQSRRVISGSVLAGRTATAESAYLGRYHQQVSVLHEPGARRLFGWLGARAETRSHLRMSARLGIRNDPVAFTTSLNGRNSALVPVEAFEHILPFDILPVPLVRALLVQDTDQAQALGCLELDPEDLALMSFICPGKNDYGEALRINLERIERWG